MKKYTLILVSFSTLFSCVINPVPVAEKTPEKINILSKVQPKMEYPYDIEVTKDGKTIYFKNWYGYPKGNDKYLDEKNSEQYEKIIKRKVIYKLDVETKKIELFKIGEDPLIYNELGNEMEIDNDGNLYVNLFNPYINKFKYVKQETKSFIYKISSKGEIIDKYDVFENDYNKYYVSRPMESPPFYRFEGPHNLVIQGNNLFYDLFIPDEDDYKTRIRIIKKLNLSNKENSLISTHAVQKTYPFIIYDNKILFDFFYEDEYSIYDTKTGDYKNIESNGLTKKLLDNISKNVKLYGDSFREIYKYYSNNSFSLKLNSKNKIFVSNLNRIYQYNLTNSENKIIGNIIENVRLRDGKSDESVFNYPTNLSIDENDNIYVADTGNNAIRKITPDGIVSTLYKENL